MKSGEIKKYRPSLARSFLFGAINYNEIVKKVEKFIFYLLLFSIPFESRLILKTYSFPFNEWMSVFLYGSDIFIGALFLLWILKKDRNLKWSKSDFFLLGFLVLSSASIIWAQQRQLAFFQSVKLAEFIWLYWYIKLQAGKVFTLRGAMLAVAVSGFLQAIVAIFQYVKQASVGLGFLGETVLNPYLPGIAVVVANGEKFLRSYGTTLHPNVLAGFLFLAIYSFYFLYLYKDEFLTWPKSLLFYSVLLFGFFLTFSRTIIFLWGLGGVIRFIIILVKPKFWILAVKLSVRIVMVVTVTFIVSGLFLLFLYPQVLSRIKISGSDQSIDLRIFYAKSAIETIPSNLLGVGAGNFVNNLADIHPELPVWQFQPVHNIFLLIGSETGIGGLALFILFLFFLAKEYKKNTQFGQFYHYSFFIIFLFIGFFDHFIWTSQPGRMMFWTVLGLISYVSRKEPDNYII